MRGRLRCTDRRLRGAQDERGDWTRRLLGQFMLRQQLMYPLQLQVLLAGDDARRYGEETAQRGPGQRLMGVRGGAGRGGGGGRGGYGVGEGRGEEGAAAESMYGTDVTQRQPLDGQHALNHTTMKTTHNVIHTTVCTAVCTTKCRQEVTKEDESKPGREGMI